MKRILALLVVLSFGLIGTPALAEDHGFAEHEIEFRLNCGAVFEALRINFKEGGRKGPEKSASFLMNYFLEPLRPIKGIRKRYEGVATPKVDAMEKYGRRAIVEEFDFCLEFVPDDVTDEADRLFEGE